MDQASYWNRTMGGDHKLSGGYGIGPPLDYGMRPPMFGAAPPTHFNPNNNFHFGAPLPPYPFSSAPFTYPPYRTLPGLNDPPREYSTLQSIRSETLPGPNDPPKEYSTLQSVGPDEYGTRPAADPFLGAPPSPSAREAPAPPPAKVYSTLQKVEPYNPDLLAPVSSPVDFRDDIDYPTDYRTQYPVDAPEDYGSHREEPNNNSFYAHPSLEEYRMARRRKRAKVNAGIRAAKIKYHRDPTVARTTDGRYKYAVTRTTDGHRAVPRRLISKGDTRDHYSSRYKHLMGGGIRIKQMADPGRLRPPHRRSAPAPDYRNHSTAPTIDNYRNHTTAPAIDNYHNHSSAPTIDNYRNYSIAPTIDNYRNHSIAPTIDNYRTHSIAPTMDNYRTHRRVASPELEESYKSIDDTPTVGVDVTKTVGRRPNWPYPVMVAMAIMNSPKGMVEVNEIYEYILERFPYYRSVKTDGWKNSVRHSLSYNSKFIKIPVNITEDQHKQRFLWKIDEAQMHKIEAWISKAKKKATVQPMEVPPGLPHRGRKRAPSPCFIYDYDKDAPLDSSQYEEVPAKRISKGLKQSGRYENSQPLSSSDQTGYNTTVNPSEISLYGGDTISVSPPYLSPIDVGSDD